MRDHSNQTLVNLRARLFELNDFGATDLIIADIREALTKLEPRIRDIKVRLVDTDDNNLNVTVFYTIKNGSEKTSTNVKLSRVR